MPIDRSDMSQGPGLSVMTYNVEGLPWPLRWGRSGAAEQIAERLRLLREEGRQPHIVLLQEAFTDAAKRIGAQAGYRYAAEGPARDSAGGEAATPADIAQTKARSFFLGERSGKALDSGLVILSDYPIVASSRIAFPDYACAGFDCLANKGVVMATIQVPGAPMSIDIVNAHLNSSGASGVRGPRRFYAFRRQIDTIGTFVRTRHDPRTPLIVAGDFNVGVGPKRVKYFGNQTPLWGQTPTGKQASPALQSCAVPHSTCSRPLPQDALWTMLRAKDWQIFSPGAEASLAVDHIAVPFGHEQDGSMLSDHVGYTAYYKLTRRL